MDVENIYFLISAIGTPLIFLIGYYVFLKDSRRSINRSFFLMSIGGTLWRTAGIITVILKKDFPLYFFFYLLAFLGALFLSSLFLQLSLFITGKEQLVKKNKTKLLLYFLPLLMFSFFSLDIIISEFFHDTR